MKNLARIFLLIVLAVIATQFIFSDFDLTHKKHAKATASISAPVTAE